MRFRPFYRFSATIALLLALAACNKATQNQQPAQGQAGQGGGQGGGQRGGRGGGQRGGGRGGPAVAVRTVSLPRISIQRQVDISGSLVAIDQAKVSSEVAGNVKDVNFELGDEVRAGQVLVQLDTTELQLAVERAESALRQTQAQLGMDSSKPGVIPPDEQIASVRTATANRDDARSQFARAEELVSKGLMAKSDHDTVETRVRVTEAALQTALENVRSLKASLQDRQASYDLAKKKVADASIRTKVAGAIAERLVQRGEYIREQTQVATIVQLNPLRLVTAAQEKYADVIRTNLPVQFGVESFPGEVFTGRVVNISPAVNQQSRTFPVEILVDNPARKLKPGFFAKGAILTKKDENVIAVPQEALMIQAGVGSVFIVENGIVKQQNVTLGIQQDKNYELLSGLKGDEILAASNLNQIVTGIAVTTTSSGEETDPPEAGAATAPRTEGGAPDAAKSKVEGTPGNPQKRREGGGQGSGGNGNRQGRGRGQRQGGTQ